jgi:hypothetical protein
VERKAGAAGFLAKNKHPVGYLKEQPFRLRPMDCFSMPGMTWRFKTAVVAVSMLR